MLKQQNRYSFPKLYLFVTSHLKCFIAQKKDETDICVIVCGWKGHWEKKWAKENCHFMVTYLLILCFDMCKG